MGIDVGAVMVWSLRATWLAIVLPIIGASLPFSSLYPLRQMVIEFSTRGKTSLASSKSTVPQRLFLHFYVVAVVLTSLLIGATWIYAHNMEALVSETFPYSATTVGDPTKGPPSPLPRHKYEVWKSVFLLLLMEIHVLRRLLESVFVFNYSPSARMHVGCYLGALYYYIAAPLSLCCNILPEALTYWANVFSKMIVNGQGQMPLIEFKFWESSLPLIKLGWRQWIGTAIFIWGWIHQYHCHKILGSLRKNRARNDEYVIPAGDWFEIVSSPHYLAEIVIYAGLFVASGASDATLFLLLITVVANLTFASGETHRWYKRKFDDYPPKRQDPKGDVSIILMLCVFIVNSNILNVMACRMFTIRSNLLLRVRDI